MDSISASTTIATKEEIEQLFQSSFDLARIDPQRSMELACRSLELARASRQQPLIANALRLVANQYFYRSDYATASEYLEQAYELAVQFDNKKQLALVQDLMAQICARRGNFADALAIMKKNMLISEYIDSPLQRHRTLVQIGIISAKQAEYVPALEAFFEALSLIQDQPRDKYYASCYNNIAAVYQSTRNFSGAAEYYRQALAVYKNCNDRQGEAVTLLNLGSIFAESHEYEAALESLRQAQALFHALGSTAREAWTHASMGAVYAKTNSNDSALYHLRISQELVEKSGNREFTTFLSMALATVHVQLQQYDAALAVWHQALDSAITTNDSVKEYECHFGLSETYEKLQDPEKALIHYKHYTALYQKVHSGETQQTIAELKARFEIERAEHERELQQLRADQLQKDIEHKNKELTLLALQIVQNSECMHRVRQHVQSMKNTGVKSRRELLRLVQASLQPEDNWKTFALQFQMIHQNFHPTLLSLCSSLTPTELKICSLLKIGLSSKDIANVLFSSVRTIETHRNTIRKKLGIAQHDSLVAFLTRL